MSTYKGLVDAIHNFSKRLAKQSTDMDAHIKNFNMSESQKEQIVGSTIESFVYTVIKTRESAHLTQQKKG
ncbi:hypothetical protein [Streptomyces sp. NPDC056401]|uniref:hypothetical protein n=1 Tax=Streptomyces sp. NPDC056401 TaxID=3345809 RepID=UPI0035DD4A15